MRILKKIKETGRKADRHIKTMLRKVSLFRRLNTSFMLLLITAAIFLTFFSFYKYSDEISKNTDRYISLLVQNVALKIEDTMQEYEAEALRFYDDSQVVRALLENAEPGAALDSEAYEQNRYCIENALYNIGYGRKYIVNIQFVTPEEPYYMVEPGGYRRGGIIRDPEAFYQTDFYRLPQEKNGYPVWFDTADQTEIFYKNEQSVYGLANIVTLGIAVYAPAGREFLGVLLLNIDLNAFAGAMEGYEAYNDGNTFMIGEDGILMWFNPSISAPAFPKDGQLFQEMKEQGKGIREISGDGQKLILAYERIPNTFTFVAHVADLDVLYAGTYQIRNLCILVLLAVVIACTVISYYVTSSISEPVGQLIKVMQMAGDGKWNERYQNSGNDEITILGDRFNEMADKTDQLIEQVYLSEIRRQKVSISWINARLDALLMQINPHFLYNTLDIIRWEAMYEAGGESPVTQMIEKFSQLYRMGMRTGGNTITLK
ncbi:sensor histidine kinase, partial [Eisenbergiella sp.]